MTLPIASVSLDLDNKWSYLKTHGDAGWDQYPTYFDRVVPRFLNVLNDRGLKITVFVVGQDAAREENHAALAAIAAAGHEIGNHSFHHEPWLHLYTEDQIQHEFQRTEEVLEQVCGVRPTGFRGPGFSFSPTVLKVLQDRGYEYDCSTFPTFLGPLARLYYFFTARLTREQKAERKQLFGTWTEGFRPLRPYWWPASGAPLMEIPVTTMPLFRTPIHVSYLLYLEQYSPLLAKLYWKIALGLCRVTGLAPSLLLHPLDFLGCDDDQDLMFFPAMRSPGARKTAFVGWVLDELARHYRIGTMRDHFNDLRNRLPATSEDKPLVLVGNR